MYNPGITEPPTEAVNCLWSNTLPLVLGARKEKFDKGVQELRDLGQPFPLQICML